RHQVRVRRSRRAPRLDRRGAHARLLAILAARRVGAGIEPAELRQAVRARLPGDARLGQTAARAGSAAGRGGTHARDIRGGAHPVERARARGDVLTEKPSAVMEGTPSRREREQLRSPRTVPKSQADSRRRPQGEQRPSKQQLEPLVPDMTEKWNRITEANQQLGKK